MGGEEEEEGHKENTKIRIIKSIFLPNACHGYLFRSEANTPGWLVQTIFATVFINQKLLRTKSIADCSHSNFYSLYLN